MKNKRVIFVATTFFLPFMLMFGCTATKDEKTAAKETSTQKVIVTTEEKQPKFIKPTLEITALNVVDNHGVKAPLIDKNNKIKTEAVLTSGEALLVTFEVKKLKVATDVNDQAPAETEEATQYEAITDDDFGLIRYEKLTFQTNREGVTLSDPDNFSFNQADSTITLNLTVTFNEDVVYDKPEEGLTIIMSTSWLDSSSGRRHYFYFKRGQGEKVMKPAKKIDKPKVSTPPAKKNKSKPNKKRQVVPINDGNIGDWEHLLDEGDIEDGLHADGRGIAHWDDILEDEEAEEEIWD